MSVLLKEATLVEFWPSRVERGDLLVEEGRIVRRGRDLAVPAGAEVVDLAGRPVLAGMVCAHTHLYSALSRGMPASERAPTNFAEILDLVWWRLDRALDPEMIRLSALVGAIEALSAGTTSLIDHHASPEAIDGSLSILSEALEEVGLRSLLCYEVTDRNGLDQARAGLAESRRFLKREPRPLVRGMVGAHASFTVGPDTLAGLAELARDTKTGLHIHVAEDPLDVADSRRRYGQGVVERLDEAGCLGPATLIAHGTHLEASELALVAERGAWMIHNPRSNMNNHVGYASVLDFGPKAALGTDGLGADMFEEARYAYFKAQDVGRPLPTDRLMEMLTGGSRILSEAFQVPVGRLEPGAVADLVMLDGLPPTPLTADNLAGHLLFGWHRGLVESVMVDGRWVMRKRRFVTIDVDAVHAAAREAAGRLWSAMAEQRGKR